MRVMIYLGQGGLCSLVLLVIIIIIIIIIIIYFFLWITQDILMSTSS